ncbi:probable disease resistance protein At4g27220 isoform X2 [Cornus florida]|uniref:probable disease resistance protein At4g27220 isoform X2 n=1 Tax=Cornus florida TaxID=4283 RepID=UPI0028990859|nr:probable disease resistance protein At4g27220 isoform X2 [Cornus florida]
MSCVIDAIVGKILDPIFDYLFSSIGRQIGYVAKYKENIKNLEEELKHLKDVRDTVQAAVDIAKANGMTIKKVAEEWLEEVEHSLTTMEEEFKDKTNIKCLDVRSRYRLGKKGKKMAMDAIKLKQNRNEFGDEVAHRTLLKDIWYTSSTSYEQFSTRASIFEEIMKALRDDKNSKIGIYGMAGVGKTTMVEEVGKQAEKGPFDEVAMAVFSQNPDLKKIQGKLADCLNLTLDRESEEGRAGQLYNRLKNGKKILVILDDVWDDKNTLKKIGIPADTDDNSMGCKILLTSRSLEVCKKMGFEKNFPIGLLSEAEAWHLFKRTVGDFIEADALHPIAQQVCRECDHLPLAICAVGGALSGSDHMPTWNDALEQLKHCRGYKIDGVEQKVYSCIEWSYKYLKLADVRSCFLHCSLFPEDTEIPIDWLVTLGVGTKFLESTDRASMKRARDRTLVIVGILKKSNLLLEGEKDNMVKMHDVVRDVVISITSKDQNAFLVKHGINVWPDKDDYKYCKAISLIASYNVRRLPDQLDCQGLCTLLLASSGDSPLELPNSFFEGMEKLEVLILENMKLEPSSLSNLISLRMLWLRGCDLVNLSFLREMKNLEILMIYHSKEVVMEIEQLTCLRSLFLGNFVKGTRLPSGSLSSLSDLEELYIPNIYNGWEVEGNASIVEINRLTSLTALHIYIPTDVFLQLPKDLPSFSLLTKYKIWIGSDHHYFFSMLDKRTETKVLGLDGIPLMDGLDVLIANAEVLFLAHLEGSKKVLHNRDREWFSDLKYLRVWGCEDMEHLLGKPKWSSKTHGPSPLGSFGKLRVLKVDFSTSIKYLFSASTARCLPKLQKLKVRGCEALEEIIGGDEEVTDKVIFDQLKILKLVDLPNLRSIYVNTKKTSTTESSTPSTVTQPLFNEKVMFPVLEVLTIIGLHSIKAIWDKQLLPVPKVGDSVQHLQELNAFDCEALEEIIGGDEEVTDNVTFHQLKKLDLRRLPNLKSIHANTKKTSTTESSTPSTIKQPLFNEKVMFPVLEVLRIVGLDNIKAIWDKQLIPVLKGGDSFKHLQKLEASTCMEMEEILAFEVGQGEEEAEANDEIPVFPHLKVINLWSLYNLKSSKEETKESRLQALVNHKVRFPSLEYLII